MSTRSTFVFWSRALAEPERLLDDLSKYTQINTIELGLSYSSSGIAGGTVPAGEGNRAVIASAKGFSGLRIPTVSDEELAAIRRSMSLVRSWGFEVACNFPALYVPSTEHVEMACVDIMGSKLRPPLSPPQPMEKPVSIYGCPNNPDVAIYSETMMRQIVTSWAPADIIMLNHVEFPLWPGRKGSAFLLQDLFSCFCDSCKEKALGEGIDFDQVRREVASLYKAVTAKRTKGSRIQTDVSASDILNALVQKPAIATWLHFRSTSMTEYVKGIVRAGREEANRTNPGMKIGLEFQLPSLSNILGTDFVELAPSFDLLAPKFPDYLTANAIPLITDTIVRSAGVGKAADLTRSIRELLDMGPGPEDYRRYARPMNMLYDVPYDLSIFDRQIKHLEPVRGRVPIYPYLWLEQGDAKMMREKVKALRKNGMDGYFVWQWEQDLTRETLRARKGAY